MLRALRRGDATSAAVYGCLIDRSVIAPDILERLRMLGPDFPSALLAADLAAQCDARFLGFIPLNGFPSAPANEPGPAFAALDYEALQGAVIVTTAQALAHGAKVVIWDGPLSCDRAGRQFRSWLHSLGAPA